MDFNNTHDDWEKVAPKLAGMKRGNPFVVPENYFNNLNAHTRTSLSAQELKLKVSEAGFTVPENYFETLSENIQSTIKLEEFKVESISDGFEIPENYFKTLADNIATSIKLAEFREKTRVDSLQVPDNYFVNLTDRIQQRIAAESEPKHEATVRKLQFGWIRYAAAACVTVAVAFGIYRNKAESPVPASLKEIPDSEIVNYLQVNSEVSDTPVIIENLSPNAEIFDLHSDATDEDLEQYINSTTL